MGQRKFCVTETALAEKRDQGLNRSGKLLAGKGLITAVHLLGVKGCELSSNAGCYSLASRTGSK